MTFVKRLTGPGVTEPVNMISADLGCARWDPERKCNVVMMGDNFPERFLRGQPWQSPSIICYDNDYNLLGIPTEKGIEMAPRRQTIDYQHHANGVSTMLPCDFIRIGEWWHLAVMEVGLGGLGDEKRTLFYRSKDLLNWEAEDPILGHPGHPGNVMLTFDRIGDWVYIFGTGGLARNRPVWMWRNKANEFPGGFWEPWGMDQVGWNWGVPNERTPVLPGRYGELCFRYIQGNCVLSFFDVDRYTCSALTVVNPNDFWPNAHRVDYAHGNQHPQLYGGYIGPDSKLNEPNGMKFIVSQWNTSSNDPYHVILFQDTLQAKGPLLAPTLPFLPAIPEPKPLPEEPVTTPQETYELLLRELSASGSTEILTPDGRKLTLREAVAEIYDQECGLHSLKGHPLHPRMSAPLLDHVLSARFEGLVNQAVICKIAEEMGIDVGALFNQIWRSIG